MNQAVARILIEEMLRGAINGAILLGKLDAEGRTELSPEEEQQLQDSIDSKAARARAEAANL